MSFDNCVLGTHTNMKLLSTNNNKIFYNLRLVCKKLVSQKKLT